MRYKKTYCKHGLIEWVGIIHMGSMTMNITFSGGCQTAYGVNPACFTTEDAFTQKFIENSDEFKAGAIKVLRVSEIAGSDEPMRAADAGTAVADRDVVDVPAPASASKKEIEVADKNEAIEYLKEHFDRGYTATALRTKSAFEAACAECGVRFVFTTEE